MQQTQDILLVLFQSILESGRVVTRPMVPMGYSGLFLFWGPMVDLVAYNLRVLSVGLVTDKEVVLAVAVASNPLRRAAFTRRIYSKLGHL